MASTPSAWPVTTVSRLQWETGRARMLGSKSSLRQVLLDDILAPLRQPITVMALAPRYLKPLWWPGRFFAILHGRPACQIMLPHFRTTSLCFIETQVAGSLLTASRPNRRGAKGGGWLVGSIRAPGVVNGGEAGRPGSGGGFSGGFPLQHGWVDYCSW